MNEDLKALLRYRLEQADESLEAAELLYEHQKFRSAISRGYYAMFYAVLALLTIQSSTTSKGSARNKLDNFGSKCAPYWVAPD